MRFWSNPHNLTTQKGSLNDGYSKFDAKSFNPEAFKYMVGRVPNLTLNALKKSRALAGNPDIRAVFTSQNGTGYARLAMRGLLDGDAVNYDGETDITAHFHQDL